LFWQEVFILYLDLNIILDLDRKVEMIYRNYILKLIKYGYIMNRYMYVMLMGGVFVENTHQETTKFPELIGDGNLL
jgi:CRISPR/Cas system-associated protein endoribonuclease Cas2